MGLEINIEAIFRTSICQRMCTSASGISGDKRGVCESIQNCDTYRPKVVWKVKDVEDSSLLYHVIKVKQISVFSERC